MTWYLLTLNAEDVAVGKIAPIKDAFTAAFRAAGGPRAMALFQKGSDGGGVELFFTPDCGSFASDFLAGIGAVPCPGPALAGLELLVGHNEITYYLTT
ncbi:hypothetical protein GPEL0_01r2473 [Geoanaerobacter pelophilus]|uniref:Uncharacterized protein n=1 Tax=Geoanaerobacter pelophilus TaxID=60036 RepID=A0ABQ0MJB2_9BACT|nr:hypothetical protein [Geoanaerobacter pelophilus]GAW66912.1 hypothetical protein GPEL0_01r2473 [Geoanaerobacter pelophilus]